MKKTVGIIFCIILVLYTCDYEKRIKIDLDSKDTISSVETPDSSIIKIGVGAMLSPSNALPAYEEIVQYIGRKLNIKVKMAFTKNYESMNKLVKTKQVIAAFVCSGPYVTAHDEWKMELIAAPSLYGKAYYYCYILVNKNSPIKVFEELKGKRFAFTDPESNTGKIVPMYELGKRGQTPDTYFAQYIYTGSHDKSIEAVAENMVDGAAVDNLIWEYMNNKDSTYTSRTRIIAKLGPYCTPPFVIHPDCSDTLKHDIKTVLLNMHKDPKGKAILNKLYIDEFVDVTDDCYQSIREMNTWILMKNNQQ